MLEMWTSQGLNIDYSYPNEPGDDLGEPGDCRNGIITNLAVKIAPIYSTTASPQLSSEAYSEYTKLEELYRPLTVPNRIISSTMPWGAGNDWYKWSNYYIYPQEGTELDD
jgi:hypothetical protein